MWSAIQIALLSLLLCLPARAQEIEIGATLACDTQQQVERFVQVFHGDAESAAKTVNSEVSDPTACDMIKVAFVRGDEIGSVRTNNRTFHIVRILVLGIVTAAGVVPAVPSAFFSVVEVDELEA